MKSIKTHYRDKFIPHCVGARDAWMWERHTGWKHCSPVDRSDYGRIVNELGKLMTEKILEGHEMWIPYLGLFTLVSVDTRVFMRDGEVCHNYSVNWNETRKLWRENPELKLKKFIYYLSAKSECVVWMRKNKGLKNVYNYKFRPLHYLFTKLSESGKKKYLIR